VPPYGLVVWARNGETGRPFKAVRLLHKQWRCPVWARQRPSGEPQIMHGAPEWWSGIGGSVEPEGPTPEPPAFARLAKSRKASPAAPVEGRIWWRDPCNLTYSPPGEVTPLEAEGRLLRALLTWNTISAERPRAAPSNSAWIAAQIERVEREAGRRGAFWHARFQPTPRDVSDSEVVLDWVGGLWCRDDRYHAVLRMRAADPPYPWRAIADALECSVATARRVYAKAIESATKQANDPRQARQPVITPTALPTRSLPPRTAR
jgi:hypothetical protein